MELAGVIGVESRRVVGQLVRRDQIDAADLGRRSMPICSRRMLDHALGEIGGLGPAGAAIGTACEVLVNMPLHMICIVCTS